MVESDSRLEWGWLSVRQGTRKLKFVYLTAWQRTVYWVDAKEVQVLLDVMWIVMQRLRALAAATTSMSYSMYVPGKDRACKKVGSGVVSVSWVR
jgi:hypothetical protein